MTLGDIPHLALEQRIRFATLFAVRSTHHSFYTAPIYAMETPSRTASPNEEIVKSYALYRGDVDAIEEHIVRSACEMKRHYRDRIQLLVLCSSRERVFSLFSRICYAVRDKQIVCHASVGSLKLDRDLKAIHFGVDILLVTPGRFARIYYGNENCFQGIQSLYLVEAEVLFTRSMMKSVRLHRHFECIDEAGADGSPL